jgi:hypothetical protein
MVAKRGKKSTGKVKNLPAKGTTADQAKKVKGGGFGIRGPRNRELNPQPLPP